ncbi:MAG: hypothetical protein OXF30_03085 [Candidatus Saccharibacteria bacterium]|nr:hypothetical protein [Candidatus Saccharibacteria bacterium]
MKALKNFPQFREVFAFCDNKIYFFFKKGTPFRGFSTTLCVLGKSQAVSDFGLPLK